MRSLCAYLAMESEMHRYTARVILFTTVALAGCASVNVIRVKSGDVQPEGIPFYMPRPYVQVFEPFVIGSKAYLVAGKLSSDGKYLLIDNVSGQGTLDGLFQSDSAREQAIRIPADSIRRSVGAPAGGSFAGAAQGETETPVAPAALTSAASAPADSASAPTGAQPTGNFNVSVTNTSSLFPPSLGRRFFDVVWMPDFDEKYVVQGKPGLGNANIGITMTQGWGLYGLDARIDNSALVKPLLDFYSTGLDALSKLAKSKILPASALPGGGAQGAVEAAQLPPEVRVTVKVTRVQVVAPGLYPILKPGEKADIVDGATADPRNLVARHIPRRPYTNIAFNTYEVVVVEAAKPSGDTPMNLQRYFDQVGAEGAPVTPSPRNLTGNDAVSKFDSTDFEKQVNDLLANRKGTGGETWKLSNLKEEGSNLTGTATLVGGTNKPTALTNMTELGAFVAKQQGSKFLPANVRLAEAK